MKLKFKLMAAVLVALVTLSFVSCSKDDDSPSEKGGIDEAVGTYKGTIDIIGQDEKFDQIIVVTKVNDKKVKVEVQNKDLNLPVKEVEVSNNANMSIQSLATEPEGIFIYTFDNKALSFLSKKTGETQLTYSFEGSKQ